MDHIKKKILAIILVILQMSCVLSPATIMAETVQGQIDNNVFKLPISVDETTKISLQSDGYHFIILQKSPIKLSVQDASKLPSNGTLNFKDFYINEEDYGSITKSV